MASYLKRAGYLTGGFYLNTNVHDLFGFGRGYDVYNHPGDGYLVRHGLDPANAANISTSSLDDRAITEELLYSLKHERSRAPRFIYLHFIGPHDPYTPPKDGPSFLQGPLTPTTAKFFEERLSASDVQHNTLSALAHGILPLDRDTLQQMRDLYDGEIAFTDRQVGEIVAAFDKAGLTESTLFVVTSDHGEEFGDHGGLGHGRTQYHELLHVPLIMAGPGVKAGGVVHSPVRLIDVLPTLLDVLNLDPDLKLDGTSFKECLAHPERDLGARELYAEGILPDHPDPYLLRSLQIGNEKLILDFSRREKLLFDLGTDQGEKENLILARPQAVSRLFAALVERHEKNRSSALPASPVALDAHADRRLFAIGYAGGTTAVATLSRMRRELAVLDTRPLGLMGDEREIKRYAPVLAFGNDDFPAEQLLYGWWDKEGDARWMAQAAGVRLKATGGETQWFVDGWIELKLHGRPSITVTVQVDGGPKVESVIDQSGAVNLSGQLASGGDCFVRLDLACDHAYIPALRGDPDVRALSLLVKRIGLR
jgi:arylsulfatase A-like enzyme